MFEFFLLLIIVYNAKLDNLFQSYVYMMKPALCHFLFDITIENYFVLTLFVIHTN
jgi:hypothetical protein